jgi:hypothetical protein
LSPALLNEFAPLDTADFNRDTAADVLARGLKGSTGLFILANHGEGLGGLQRIAPDEFIQARAFDLGRRRRCRLCRDRQWTASFDTYTA